MWRSSRSCAPSLADARDGQAAAFQAAALPAQRHHRGFRAARLPVPGRRAWPGRDQVPVEEVYRRAAAINKHDVCNMQYTSGTTGFPKGVMLTHYNVVNNGKAIGDCMDLSTADRMMIQVPMFHCFGMVLAMTASMTHGTTMSPIPAFSPRKGSGLHQPASRSPPSTACPPCSSPCSSHPDFAKTDFQPHAHRHHGGQPLPHQGDAGRDREDAHAGDLHHLRPDRGLPRLHHEQDHRLPGGPREHRGRRHVRRGVQDRGSGDRRGSARRRGRRVRAPGATTS